jgi:hypothetical protein
MSFLFVIFHQLQFSKVIPDDWDVVRLDIINRPPMPPPAFACGPAHTSSQSQQE